MHQGIGKDREIIGDTFGIRWWRRPSVAFTEDADEVWPAAIDLIEADADDPVALGLFLGDSPAKIDIGERDASFAAEGADFRKDLLDKVLALFLQVAEGRADEHAEFG
jgi:hypothetical protein